ncbi:MAG: hypothetical protein COA45_03955 [Zetaproteobacteria bacterium]|nr:MAG: hypothetical protein COA45_03955 [Zetaproteobacteria bacterium]
MFKKIILGQIRHLLGAGGTGFTTWLLAHGASATDVDVMVSGLLAAIGFMWSAYTKYREDNKPIKIRKLNAVFMLFGLALLLSGCSAIEKITDNFEKPNCQERVAIVSHVIITTSNEVVIASQEDRMSVKNRRIAIDSIDSAMNIADRAGAFCSLNEVVADDYVDALYDTVKEITALIGE